MEVRERARRRGRGRGSLPPLLSLTLQAVARLRLLANDVQHRVDELGALGVVALGPVVAGARLCVGRGGWSFFCVGLPILRPLARLFPSPLPLSLTCPNTKLSGRKIWPYGPARTESMVPGSRSSSTARGT